MKTVKEILKNYAELAHNLALHDYKNEIYCVELSDAEKAMEEYAQERTKDCYPKEFVEWWFTKGIMEFAIEAFSTPTLFIKFNEGSRRKYILDELFTYWKEQIK